MANLDDHTQTPIDDGLPKPWNCKDEELRELLWERECNLSYRKRMRFRWSYIEKEIQEFKAEWAHHRLEECKIEEKIKQHVEKQRKNRLEAEERLRMVPLCDCGGRSLKCGSGVQGEHSTKGPPKKRLHTA